MKILLKALSWRVIATSTTTAIAFLATGSLSVSLSIGVTEAAAKVALFMGHEHVWTHVERRMRGKGSYVDIDSVTS